MKGVLEQLLEEIQAMKNTGYKHDATGTPNARYFHGTQGILSLPGLDPQVFSTIVGIEPGMIGEMDFIPSVYDTPYYETLTGIQADIGSEPTTECADCLQPGLLKGCTLSSAFGRICRDTREILLERIGQRVNRSDAMDLQLMNLLGIDSHAPDGVPPDRRLDMELTKVLLEYGVSVERMIAQMVWAGNVANAVGTGYVPFNGFDLLIATGHTDILTGTSCPSLDSDIKNFNYQLITATNPADIVALMSIMYHVLRRLAETTGMMPVQWVIAMRSELFHELTQMWPCRYGTFGCNVSGANQTAVINSLDMVRERDRLRAQRVLPIEGVELPVVLDVGIVEETNGDNGNIPVGQMASDIYFIPISVLGRTPVTYMEYFQFNNPQMAPTLEWFHTAEQVWTTNNGAWFWSNARTAACLKAKGVIRPRLILRTPQLAGRIQNVRYNPLQHERTPFPGLDNYFVDGGDTYESSWPISRYQ